MKNLSALNNYHILGLFGNYENKEENNLIKVSEIKNQSIYQIVKFNSSKILANDMKLHDLNFPQKKLEAEQNDRTRILWMGPNNWMVVSDEKVLESEIDENFSKEDFAVTNLSHSRAIIQLEGFNIKEVLKKGCPLNFNEFKKDNCANSVFHGITITIDMVSEDPEKIRILALRSFGGSIYHSLTDACLENGYKAI
jgi:sarcosine oxidase subunit gamma